MDNKSLVILPTYNEATNIISITSRILACSANVDILIVDDNSPDGTGQIADSISSNSSDRIHVLHRTHKGGLGPAYLAGFEWGIGHGYELLIEMDADGSHQPEELPDLLKKSTHSDLVIGTRWMPGGSVKNWPLYRRLISQLGTQYASRALNSDLRDMTSGYRVLSQKLVTDILQNPIQSNGYSFQIEIVRFALQNNYRVTEVPITFIERVTGRSKMNKGIVFEAFWLTTRWYVQRISMLLKRR